MSPFAIRHLQDVCNRWGMRLTLEVNSAETGELKNKWTSIVAGHAFINELVKLCDVEKYKYLEISELLKEECSEKYKASYESIRNKVCEILVARALARPKPHDTSRQALVKKAMSVVNELEGRLTPSLDMRAAATANSDEKDME